MNILHMNLFSNKHSLNNNVNTIILIMFIMVLLTIVFYSYYGNHHNVVEEIKDSVHVQKIQLPVVVETQNINTDTLQTK